MAPQDLKFERVHRALGPRSTDLKRPRDILCCMLHYTHREIILRNAWELGEIIFSGSPIKLLADISRNTLQRRALLRPLLDKIMQLGGTYRWGYPISLTVRKGHSSFFLSSPADLPGLFFFLETEAIPIPHWLKAIPGQIRRRPAELRRLDPESQGLKEQRNQQETLVES